VIGFVYLMIYPSPERSSVMPLTSLKALTLMVVTPAFVFIEVKAMMVLSMSNVFEKNTD
jgi:hypothetical protein